MLSELLILIGMTAGVVAHVLMAFYRRMTPYAYTVMILLAVACVAAGLVIGGMP